MNALLADVSCGDTKRIQTLLAGSAARDERDVQATKLDADRTNGEVWRCRKLLEQAEQAHQEAEAAHMRARKEFALADLTRREVVAKSYAKHVAETVAVLDAVQADGHVSITAELRASLVSLFEKVKNVRRDLLLRLQ